jgi:hypothetical protein
MWHVACHYIIMMYANEVHYLKKNAIFGRKGFALNIVSQWPGVWRCAIHSHLRLLSVHVVLWYRLTTLERVGLGTRGWD